LVRPVEEEKKNVTFSDDEDSDEEVKEKLVISEEDASLDIPELHEEVDEMAELEKKASETLVLNL
jgi:hypothetical protein